MQADHRLDSGDDRTERIRAEELLRICGRVDSCELLLFRIPQGAQQAGLGLNVELGACSSVSSRGRRLPTLQYRRLRTTSWTEVEARAARLEVRAARWAGFDRRGPRFICHACDGGLHIESKTIVGFEPPPRDQRRTKVAKVGTLRARVKSAKVSDRSLTSTAPGSRASCRANKSTPTRSAPGPPRLIKTHTALPRERNYKTKTKQKSNSNMSRSCSSLPRSKVVVRFVSTSVRLAGSDANRARLARRRERPRASGRSQALRISRRHVLHDTGSTFRRIWTFRHSGLFDLASAHAHVEPQDPLQCVVCGVWHTPRSLRMLLSCALL